MLATFPLIRQRPDNLRNTTSPNFSFSPPPPPIVEKTDFVWLFLRRPLPTLLIFEIKNFMSFELNFGFMKGKELLGIFWKRAVLLRLKYHAEKIIKITFDRFHVNKVKAPIVASYTND